jgi:hypothetical protein
MPLGQGNVLLHGQRLAKKSAGKTVRFNGTLGDWTRRYCV